MGMTGGQKFFRVELPLALPLIVSGVRLALVQVWATATIAALVAGPGLGRVITDGFFRTNYGKGIAGAVVVGIVALVLELIAAGAAARWSRRPDQGRVERDNDPGPLSAASSTVTEGSDPHRRSVRLAPFRTRVADRPRDTEGTPACRIRRSLARGPLRRHPVSRHRLRR